MKDPADIRAEWLGTLLSTSAADRPAAETAVRQLYHAAGFAGPERFIWFDSPFRASWVVAVLVAPYHQTWSQRLASLSRDDRPRADAARSTLGAAFGTSDPQALVAAAGGPLSMHLQYPPNPSRMLSTRFFTARFALGSDVATMFKVHGDDDDLARAESWLHGGNRGALRSALHCPTTDLVIANSFFEDYSFSTMADDEARVGNREAPPIMRAAWNVARSSGMWWPFEHVAIMSERPAELHLNDRFLLHRDDGPAAVYGDGWKVFAWNGKAVPERWIMDTAGVPPREYKGFDPTFAKHAKSKTAAAPKTKKRVVSTALTRTVLPSDHAARLERLRAHAGGSLPRYDRYVAGAYREVWAELVALGPSVREEPLVADALAVAYETMRRVGVNVRRLGERLESLGYTFATPGGRGEPPPANTPTRVIAFEKAYGALPLSLRAFYEVVGEVNFLGAHPAVNPSDGSIATDPLVVYALDEGAVEFDEDDEDGAPSAITIAPDDLHKANTSGGAPYEMPLPDLRADAELLNERHGLLFVDYLRLCFRFGGFPGYDGAERVPSEIASLREGLEEM